MSIILCLRSRCGGDWSLYPEIKGSNRCSASDTSVPEDFQELTPALGLSQPTNSHKGEAKPRKRRGSKGLSSYGRQSIHDCAVLLEEETAGRPIGFLTLTLPFSDPKLLDQATLVWSEIVRKYLQELRRELERRNLPTSFVGVSEWQARAALHLHLAFIASNSKKPLGVSSYPIPKDWFRVVWRRILNNCLGQEFDCSAATRVERVRSSVGGYLGKYLSKGEKPRSTGCEVFPSAWWFASNNLKREAKRRVKTWKVTLEGAEIDIPTSSHEYWIAPGLEIAKRIDCWGRFRLVCSGEVPRAYCGRAKVSKGWTKRLWMALYGCTNADMGKRGSVFLKYRVANGMSAQISNADMWESAMQSQFNAGLGIDVCVRGDVWTISQIKPCLRSMSAQISNAEIVPLPTPSPTPPSQLSFF